MLGKFEYEVLALRPEQFARQCAYLRIKQKELDQERRKDAHKTKPGRKPPRARRPPRKK